MWYDLESEKCNRPYVHIRLNIFYFKEAVDYCFFAGSIPFTNTSQLQ